MSRTQIVSFIYALLILGLIVFVFLNIDLAINHPYIEIVVCSVGLSICIPLLTILLLRRSINNNNKTSSNQCDYHCKNDLPLCVYTQVRRGLIIVRNIFGWSISDINCQ